MKTTEDRYPEVLLQCGAPHGDEPCEQALYVKLSLSDNAIYMCKRGHRIGEVSEVDEYLVAMVLGALSRPSVRQKFVLAMVQAGSNLAVVPEQRWTFADWWDGASPRQRYDVMSSAIERVLVAPESILDLDSALVMSVQWK